MGGLVPTCQKAEKRGLRVDGFWVLAESERQCLGCLHIDLQESNPLL